MRLLFFLLLSLMISTISHAQRTAPVPIIFDTDFGPDYDDVGAIALLHALADSGEAKILAVMASNKNPPIAADIDLFNTYFNRPDIPIGVPRGKAQSIHAKQGWDTAIIARYPHTIKSNVEAEDAVSLYRRILSNQPDRSVTIVTVGFLTNLAALLNSGPDQFSKLEGEQLVEKKVKRLVCMAGWFPSGKEFNVHIDAPASIKVFNDWPTSIFFSGFEIGKELLTGIPLIQNNGIQHSPVKDVFAISIPLDPNDKNGRMSWDETAVLIAIRGWEPYYTLQTGRMVVSADGSNSWNDKGKGHAYIVRKKPVAEMAALINQLIMHQPIKK